MAIKFKGDTTVAIINSIKKAEVDTVYRCFDSGVLLSNEVINHGDFVSWDGTKWIKRSDLSYLIDNAAAPIDQQIMSNIAPAYVKQPYPANSYVTKGGVLYTNATAIDTAEDWNPAHWTQTTVAEMLSSAGGAKWTNRETSVSIAGDNTEQIDIQDHEYVTLHVTHTGSYTNGILNLHLRGECYVELDKAHYTVVKPYIENASPIHILNTGIAYLASSGRGVLSASGSGIPEEYNPDEFTTVDVLDTQTDVVYAFNTPNMQDALRFLLHSLGNGTLIITQLPS